MASETESYTTGCIIREYHARYYVYKDVWLSYTGEVATVSTVSMMKVVQKVLSDRVAT